MNRSIDNVRDILLRAGEEPPLASHLVTPRTLYSHHGIYVGDGRVIHYAGLAYGLRRGPVEEISLERFARGRSVRIRRGASRFDDRQAVARARARLGECRYRLLTNNCKHFCAWVLRGESVRRSGQSETSPPSCTDEGDAGRYDERNASARSGNARDRQFPTNALRTFTHAHQAEVPFSPAVEHGGRNALAVVADSERQRLGVIAKLDIYSRCRCMAHRIGQRLARNAHDFFMSDRVNRSFLPLLHDDDVRRASGRHLRGLIQ
jgi:Lecithin retinol acyltransferase